MKIGIVGGTGPAGRGLALRLASVGYEIEIGSRSSGRAAEIVDELIEVWGDKDGIGQKVTLNRGTELSNIGRSRSTVEMISLPMLLFLGAICMFAFA